MSEPAIVPSGRVCIAVPTFRRPVGLRELLNGLSRQRFPDGFQIEVVVFDNDAIPSGRVVVESMRPFFPVSLGYVHAPEPGLSAVRNTVLGHAIETYDLVAMIDDDEYPEPQWIAELLSVAERTDADATFGPVRFRMPPHTPRWIGDGRFFDMSVDAADGERIRIGYSGNCLLRVASLRRFGVRFDRSLDFAGGEDLLFFRQLLDNGAKFVYAARAETTEIVVAERARTRYILKLNYRRGNTLAICDVRVRPGISVALLRAAKGLLRLSRGAAGLVPLSLTRGRRGALVAACDVAHGLGSLTGLFGFVYQAYGRADARAS